MPDWRHQLEGELSPHGAVIEGGEGLARVNRRHKRNLFLGMEDVGSLVQKT